MSTLGLVFLVLAAVLAVAEAHVVSFGVLGGLAVASLVAGVALVIAGAGANFAVALGVAAAAGVLGVVGCVVLVRQAMRTRRTPVRGGATGVIGRRGEVRTPPAPVGRVLVDGALWRARAWAVEDEPPLHTGEAIVVEGVDGLTLTVRRAEEWEVAP